MWYLVRMSSSLSSPTNVAVIRQPNRSQLIWLPLIATMHPALSKRLGARAVWHHLAVYVGPAQVPLGIGFFDAAIDVGQLDREGITYLASRNRRGLPAIACTCCWKDPNAALPIRRRGAPQASSQSTPLTARKFSATKTGNGDRWEARSRETDS